MLTVVSLGLALAAETAGAPAEPAIVAEARAFMTGYANDLIAGDRAAIAARYSRAGAYNLGRVSGPKDSWTSISARYAGPEWQRPAAFAWQDLSYIPLGPDSAAVVGAFLWTTPDSKRLAVAYTGVLQREAGELRLVAEHESLLK